MLQGLAYINLILAEESNQFSIRICDHKTSFVLDIYFMMFPIIPKLAQTGASSFSSAEVNYARRNFCNERKGNVKLVAASGFIPVNVSSSVWFAEDMRIEDDLKRMPLLLHHNEGRLQPFPINQSSMWPQILPIAEDIQSQNVILEINKTEDQKCGLVVRSVKNISDGDEIQMWFTEEISALISMPFLTPRNIRDQKRYVCHICGKQFEYPNPLKLHIALDCGRLPISYIWNNLREILLNMNSPNIVPLNLSNRLSPITPTSNNSKTSPIMTFEPHSVQEHITKRQSAFVPYSVRNYTEAIESITKLPLFIPQRINYNPTTQLPTQESFSEISFRTHASQMEAIVSNLGKSNKGHLCIYCGKVYSRKYGLKIHIRTHTGFKPLKCKFCSRAFGDPSNLNKHVRLHLQGESPYRCDICNKVLVRRRDLQRHLQTRHGTGNSTLESDSSD